MKDNRPYHTLLPKEAQRILREATNNNHEMHSLTRVRLVEQAIQRVKRQFPEYFKKD